MKAQQLKLLFLVLILFASGSAITAADLTTANPTLPEKGAFYTGEYRNMFVEAGYDESEVKERLETMWNQYFVTGDSTDQKLFYEVGDDMGFIKDIGNNDIRSEGVSYGLMICVQMDKKEYFDKIFKFIKTYMQHPIGDDREGLLSWQLNSSSFDMMDPNSAPDGEEYVITALFFADKLWGSTNDDDVFESDKDILDYRAQANYMLQNCLNKAAPSSGACPTALFDEDEKQVVFGICGSSASFTDPSYHLPHFYEIWAIEADEKNQLFLDMADKSRTYLLPNAAHETTGLMPDYSEFDGTPKENGTHGNFEYDAWRNIMNMSLDISWFQKDTASLSPLINKQINFFKDKPDYAGIWPIDGSTPRLTDHNAGLVACNAVSALALEDAKVWPFVQELYEISMPEGKWRYYDGLLYMMSFMQVAGEFKAFNEDVTSTKFDDTLKRENEILIFPNPVKSSVTVSTAIEGNLLLLNSRGDVVNRFENSETAKDISNLPSGRYFIAIEENGKFLGLKDFFKTSK